jgi:hypothetical protein
VQAVILARLDLLTPEERRLVQRAAVVGRRFWDGAAAALTGGDNADAILRTLRRREFVVERLASSIAGEREFTFKHVLIRDVAYESLPRAERGRAHAETAAWIGRTLGDRVGERAEMLAHHYDAAYSYLRTDELRHAAREHLLAGAASAHRRFADDEGDRLARRAVELSQAGAERLAALEALGDLHWMSGDAAWQAYTDALAEVAPAAPAYARLAGKVAVYGSRWIGTMRELPEVADVRRVIAAGLETARPGSPERALLLVDDAFLMFQREGRTDAGVSAAVAEALAAAEELDDADLLSAALDAAQAVHVTSGRYGGAHRLALRRVGLVPRMRDVREIGDAHAMAAWTTQHIGRYRDAETHAAACVELARDRDAGLYAFGLAWRVQARHALGDWEGALSDQAEIERVAAGEPRDLPASFTMPAYVQAGLCHELRGGGPRADAYLDLALRYFDHRKRFAMWSGPSLLALPTAAQILARRRRFDEALAILDAAPGPSAGLAFAARCEIAAERAAWSEVPALATASREEAAKGELLALPLVVDRLEGRAAAAAGDAEAASLLLRRSADGFRELEAAWEEAWSRLLLGEVLLPGDRSTAEPELAPALAVFERLGSVREIERSRSALAGAPA